MALVINTGSINAGNAPGSSTTAYTTLQGNSWSGATLFYTLQAQWGYSAVNENTDNDGEMDAESGSWNHVVGAMNADTTVKFRAKASSGTTGTTKSKKTAAILATASTPSSSSITSTTATIACNYFPNVNESTCSAQLQYKRTVDSTWTNAGTAGTTGGYSQVAESEAITGLTPSTNYNVRLVVTRNTSNADGQSLTSTTHTFSTLAGEPETTTNAASSISSTTATLSQTVDVNSGTGIQYYWKWGTDNPPTQNTTAKTDVSVDGTVTLGISGLTASTTYYHQAYVDFTTPTGSPNSGSVLSFATSADPAEEAADEDHMITQYYDALYATATAITFTLRSPAATSSDLYYTGTAPVEADFTMIQDGTAMSPSVADNAPTGPVGTYLYKLTVSAAELTCDVLDIVIHDAAGAAFRDQHIQIRTVQNISKVVVNATNRTNTTAVTYTGVGSGHGLSAVGGATGKDIDGYMGGPAGTLYWADDATGDSSTQVTITTGTGPYSYSATADAYNGHILVVLAGTGAGQARPISDYDGAGVVTLSPAFAVAPSGTVEVAIIPGPRSLDVTPGAELSATPTFSSSYGQMLLFLFQRFAYRRKQDAQYQYLYKADNTTLLSKGTFEDNTTDQDLGKLADG